MGFKFIFKLFIISSICFAQVSVDSTPKSFSFEEDIVIPIKILPAFDVQSFLLEDENEIKLPDYWIGLVDEDSITVQLTAIGKKQDLWVEDCINNSISIGSSTNQVECFYFIQAERKDVEKLKVEV